MWKFWKNNRGEVAAVGVAEPLAGTAAAPAAIAPGSASTTVPGVAGGVPPPVPAPSFVIPDTYKDKSYLKGVDSQEKLFAMLDGAQTLIGKHGPAIPAADADPKEWDAFYEALGRPKAATEYKFATADKTDPKLLTGIQGAMHKHGLTQKQAEGVWTDVEASMAAVLKERGVATEKANVDFTKLATDTFGVERDRVLASGKALIEANMSPAMKAHLDTLPNESLILMADVLNNISKKYIKQDGAGAPPTTTGSTPDGMRDTARALMSEQLKHSPMSVEFNNIQKQINAIYDDLRKANVKF